MGLIEMASGNSVWRGMDYYERKMVCSWKKSGEETYDGVVSGSEGNKYSVHAMRCICMESRRGTRVRPLDKQMEDWKKVKEQLEKID